MLGKVIAAVRRPMSSTGGRVVGWLLFFVLVIGLRLISPQFRSEMGPLSNSGLQIEDHSPKESADLASHAESVLFFDPTESRVRPGEVITLQAMIDTAANRVSGAELHVQFDPSQISLEQISASPVFSLSLQNPVIDNAKGEASVALGVPLGQPAVSGRYAVANFLFRAERAISATEVVFSERSLVAADNETGSVIREIRSARITGLLP
ncbi:MAG: hypothetical protein E6Q06_00895 [Candidatus Moraniibacteriota bacterium]|nr:MAG: hypothetical protein E6Q06_00895 [Candidatus Moranbacteria bacterium]